MVFFLSFLFFIGFTNVFSADLDFDNYDDDDASVELNRNYDWDVLVFTQQWPVTTCYHWMEENEHHNCNLPQKKEIWTIHGIWPTQSGKVGPNFCNKSSPFDINKLDPILADLKMYWPEIELAPDINSLWKHEWMKHGTCAAAVNELNDELKYFQQGLFWRAKFLISNILGSAGIHPDSSNTVINIHNALKKVLNRNPSIHCLYDRKKDASYLSEIRICFNKTLDLIDCDGVSGAQVSIDYPGGKVITNCHISKPVQYPSIVPPLKRDTWMLELIHSGTPSDPSIFWAIFCPKYFPYKHKNKGKSTPSNWNPMCWNYVVKAASFAVRPYQLLSSLIFILGAISSILPFSMLMNFTLEA